MLTGTPHQLGELTSVCCVCGVHLRGPWLPGPRLSHGLCTRHFEQALKATAALNETSRASPTHSPRQPPTAGNASALTQTVTLKYFRL